MSSLIDTITDCPACKPRCPRCLEPRKPAYRIVSDIMDIEVCDDCAIEVWRYDGPIGQLRVIRLERQDFNRKC